MYKIQTLNSISPKGLERLPGDKYDVADGVSDPDAIMLRSYKMHDMDIPASVKAIGRAGAGVNNIPVDKMTEQGIPVFNAPGANANAVKELVIAGMLLAARNIYHAAEYTAALVGTDEEVTKAVEDGKKKYKGYELPGRTLGVIGLGAIGLRVANDALGLGMKVIGFDPSLTVRNAWQLSSGVEQAVSVEDLLSRADFVTMHVPLIDATKNLINAERIKGMPDGAVVMNFARGGVVDEEAVLAALDTGKLHSYVCDFPTNANKNHSKVIALPHLGASTDEAEDNCAVMVANQLRDYLENGNITNAVNFPEAILPRVAGATRLAIVNKNVPNMLGQISSDLAVHSLNIKEMLNKSLGNIAYTLVDIDGDVPDAAVEKLRDIDGVLTVRVLK